MTGPLPWLLDPDALHRLGTPDLVHPHPAVRWDGTTPHESLEQVAEECPVSIVYNDVPHVVMMATPSHLVDFVLGFSYTEGLIGAPDDLLDVACLPHSRGMEMQVRVTERCMEGIEGRTRRLSGRTGCGVCGSESVDAVLREVPPVPAGQPLAVPVIQRALDGLVAGQELNALAGAVHAAAWSTFEGEILLVREDVGRHNALDKLVGALLTRRIDPQSGFVVVTSRASFEMVHKAAMLGTSHLVTVSGATALAVRMAHQANLTLAGFARRGRMTVYTHAERIVAG